ncbi:MAG: SDR family NAD(P)-dependent oxidoreductase [Alphaproteobacteria bacterium]|nr:SDR family NAD(P)-dependent oxidoreductase [Alphaproteobacteria bacterium]
MTDYHGRAVVVTGGTGALGQAVVRALLARGASCVVPYVAPAEAERFPFKDRVTLVGPVDLASDDDAARVYDRAGAIWASIHLAGGFAMTAIGETMRVDVLKMLEMNLVTCQLCCAAAVRALRRTGQGGRIVNVAARPALEPRLAAGMAAYGASKAAVAALTQALAEEVAADGILVNAVAPSIIDTPANRAAMPKARHELWPKVDEIAATILFLASPDNRVTRGAIVPVYGKS